MPIRVPIAQQGLSTQQTPSLVSGPQPSVPGDVVGRQTQQLGQNLQALGEVTVGLAAEMRHEEDTATSKQAFNEFTARSFQMLDGDDGYLRLEGKAAVGESRQTTLDGLRREWQDIQKRLPTSVSRGMFGQAAEEHMRGIERRVHGHEATQRRIWHLGETRAMQQEAVRNAIAIGLIPEAPEEIAAANTAAIGDRDIGAIQDPEARAAADAAAVAGLQASFEAEAQRLRVPEKPEVPLWQVHLNTALEQAGEESAMLGEGTEARNARLMDVRVQVYGGIVQGLIADGRTKEAEAFLGKVPESKLDPLVRTELNRAIGTARRADDAFDRAADLEIDLTRPREAGANTAPAAPLPGTERQPEGEFQSWEDELDSSVQAGRPSGLDPRDSSFLLEADNRLRAMLADGKIDARDYDMTMGRLKERHALLVRAHADRTQALLLEAEQFFERNPGARLGGVDSASFPIALRQELIEVGKLDDARSLAQLRHSSPPHYLQLLKDFETGKLRDISPSQLFSRYRAYLAPHEWNEAQSMHAEANRLPATNQTQVNRQLRRVAADAGILSGVSLDTGVPKPDNETEARLFFAFTEEVQRRTGISGDPTGENQLRLAKEIGAETVMVGQGEIFGFDDKAFAWDPAYKGQEKNFYVRMPNGTEINLADIPSGAQKEVLDAWRYKQLPAHLRTEAREKLREFGAHTEAADRDAIESMWVRLGVPATSAPPQFQADTWVSLTQNPQSRWFEGFGEGRSDDPVTGSRGRFRLSFEMVGGKFRQVLVDLETGQVLSPMTKEPLDPKTGKPIKK